MSENEISHPRGSDRGGKSASFVEEARRAQIISCAVSCIAETGYTATTVADVARRAGVSKGVVFYHFKGKDDLIRQVIVGVYTEAAEYMLEAIGEEQTYRGRLRCYIESNLRYFQENTRNGLVLQDILRHWHPASETPSVGKLVDEDSVRPLEGLLLAGQQAGEFGAFSVRLMAISIRRAIDGALEEWSHHMDDDIMDYARELVNIFDRATVTQGDDE